MTAKKPSEATDSIRVFENVQGPWPSGCDRKCPHIITGVSTCARTLFPVLVTLLERDDGQTEPVLGDGKA